MKRLSEVEEFKNVEFSFKFLKKEHVDMLLDGTLYMNTLEYYIELEKQTKIRGQGDKYEGSNVYGVQNVNIYSKETGKLLAKAKSAKYSETYPLIKKIPIFCYTVFTSEDFKVVNEEDDFIEFCLDIAEEEKNMLSKDFGDYAVCLPDNFSKLVIDAANQQDCGALVKKVTYDDYSILNPIKQKIFEEKPVEIVTWKDDFFSYQREKRFALLEPSEKPVEFKVSNLRNEALVMATEEFLKNGQFKIEFNK